MQKLLLCLYVIIILTGCTGHGDQKKQDTEGTLSISGAFALYPIMVKWSEEYRKTHPDIHLDISAGGAGKGITDALSDMTDIGMVSRDLNSDELKKGAYGITVVKDAVVATVSSSNPDLKTLLEHGLKKELAQKIWLSQDNKSWGNVLGLDDNYPVHVYTRSDAAGAAECWARYLGKKQEDLLGTGVFGDPGLATAIIKDPLSIGYNNIAYVYDSHTRRPNTGIVVVPLDLNNNGHIEPEENFYGNIDELIKAVITGKYPSPPVRNLLLVTNGKPSKKILTDFIRWILTDGQKFVEVSGYIGLPKDTLISELKKLNN